MTEDEIADVTIKHVLVDADYNDYFKRTNQNLYGSKKVNMPTPELYDIFTGERKNIPDTISLSKEFFNGAKIALDAEVKILYMKAKKILLDNI